MKRLVYILMFIMVGTLVKGQQLPLYSQYLYNKFLINPGVAGSDGYTSVNLTAREQWVGYYGAPRTFSFSVQARIMKSSYTLKRSSHQRNVYRPKTDGRVGLGGYIFSDMNGIIHRTGFQMSYAYHLWLENETQLSMGLAFTGYHYKINESEISFEDPNDPLLNSNLRRGMFVPDASFGVYLLNARYSAGFSADQLFEAAGKISNGAYKNVSIKRHYYLFGSYSFEPNTYVILEPSFMFLLSDQFKPQLDIGLTYIYNNSFWAGLAFRTSGAIIASTGVKYLNLWFGYSFDFTLQEIQRITYGTHELTVALKFGDSARRYRWLDRY